jgi:hypothetical protein
MSDLPCDCCEGPKPSTPRATANRAGLPALRYRAGTYASFFDSMRARLSSARFFGDVRAKLGHEGPLDLAGLKTREMDDFSIALLDAWAVTGDVLTFYQERIANEGYLRCATERRSVLELARLAGYALRPGVAASVFLAYSLDKDAAPVEIPKGARVNSLPGPGEQMEAFETSEPLLARVEWNEIAPRMSRPLALDQVNATFIERVRFKGTSLNLAVNDAMLFVFGRTTGKQVLRKIAEVKVDNAAGETEVLLQLPIGSSRIAMTVGDLDSVEVLSPGERAVLAAWAEVAGRYADTTWRCLDEHKPQVREVKAGLSAVQKALEVIVADSVPTDAERDALEQANQRVMAAVTVLLHESDKDELAWVRDYFVEVFHFLSSGRISEAESRELFYLVFKPVVTNFSQLSQGLVATLIPSLAKARSQQPANSQRLARATASAYAPISDINTRLLGQFQPGIGRTLYQAWRNVPISKPAVAEVFVLRTKAPLFGHNAQKRTRVTQAGEAVPVGDWHVIDEVDHSMIMHEDTDTVYLDQAYPKILAHSWVVVSTPSTRLTTAQTQFFLAGDVSTDTTRAQYGMTGKTTRIALLASRNSLPGTWINAQTTPSSDTGDDFDAIRKTVVYAQSEKLTLAELPITYDVCGARVELGALYDGLEAGRWAIVSGERSDLKDDNGDAVAGVTASELVMISAVQQNVARVPSKTNLGARNAARMDGGSEVLFALGAAEVGTNFLGESDDEGDNEEVKTAVPGDRVVTYLEFAEPLSYKFKRATVKIRANVVRATHGETRREVLGSGDAAKALQTFVLKQAPLTFTSAATVSGVASSLTVRVNDIEWHETDTLAGLAPDARRFITRTDDDGKTSIVFGNGVAGARLPGGQENVRAVYRSGIGKPGNVKAEQISLLATRPLGAKGVINPLRASGGANAETRDQARKNAPLAVMALDRLVSVQDHADFARTFGGVGKAVAAERSDGRRQVVHLTIAGVDDIPIAANSDLLRNLRTALRLYGDPALPIRLQVRERLALVVSARVRILPDYLWEAVEAQLRGTMLEAFGFEALELGDDLFASRAIALLQGVRGVDYVDLDVFDVISEGDVLNNFKSEQAAALTLKQRIVISSGSGEGGNLRPSQIAYLSPDVADTLILQEIPA